MRVAVSGGRDYNEQLVVWTTLDAVHTKHGITLLIHGACHVGGADILAEDWAKSRQVDYLGVPAKWKRDGKSAGPIRNTYMLKTFQPELLVRFPGGLGTAHCQSEAERLNIPVFVVS